MTARDENGDGGRATCVSTDALHLRDLRPVRRSATTPTSATAHGCLHGRRQRRPGRRGRHDAPLGQASTINGTDNMTVDRQHFGAGRDGVSTCRCATPPPPAGSSTTTRSTRTTSPPGSRPPAPPSRCSPHNVYGGVFAGNCDHQQGRPRSSPASPAARHGLADHPLAGPRPTCPTRPAARATCSEGGRRRPAGAREEDADAPRPSLRDIRTAGGGRGPRDERAP